MAAAPLPSWVPVPQLHGVTCLRFAPPTALPGRDSWGRSIHADGGKGADQVFPSESVGALFAYGTEDGCLAVCAVVGETLHGSTAGELQAVTLARLDSTGNDADTRAGTGARGEAVGGSTGDGRASSSSSSGHTRAVPKWQAVMKKRQEDRLKREAASTGGSGSGPG